MANDLIYNKWTEFINEDNYKKHFLSNEDIWLDNFKNVKKYIDKNDEIPSRKDKLGRWINNQITNYKLKEYIMANELIHDKWTELINEDKYKIHFLSNEDVWIFNLNIVKKYIDEKGQKPSQYDKEEKIKQLGKWISHQITNYKSKKYIMANNLIYNKWTELINEDNYKKHFLSNEAEWIINLNIVKKYIDENGQRPSTIDKEKNIKQSGSWIYTQMKNYKSKKQIMAIELIHDKWTDFINKDNYKKFFIQS